MINLEDLNQKLKDIDSYPTYHVLDDPKLGVAYLNKAGQKRFSWCSDIAKYSDDTLYSI